MAKVKVNTKTETKSYPRLKLLKMQVIITLRKLVDLSDNTRTKIDKALDKQWIKIFKIYGCDSTDKKICELVLSIDWERHTLNLEKNSTVVVNKKWKDGVMIELNEAIELFNGIVEESNLTTDYVVIFNEKLNLNREQIKKEMGYITAPVIDWKNEPVSCTSRNNQLSEFGIEVKIANID